MDGSGKVVNDSEGYFISDCIMIDYDNNTMEKTELVWGKTEW